MMEPTTRKQQMDAIMDDGQVGVIFEPPRLGLLMALPDDVVELPLV